jgi:type III secretion protein S
MVHDALLTKLNAALLSILYSSAPVLLTAVAIGVLVGLLQALTQIHDQTLPQAIKIVATLILLMILGPIFARGIADQASSSLDEFAVLTR